ncbi:MULTISPECIES: hypothetical protein [Halococcus]|uniref:Uncharacterized protein n=1 Tax=Halococcus salifodinae DSM 8989 TaxID=1227456 RepID=M0MXA2_9EURY|nr:MULTISPECIES: hypothetical protein [Halococcus]EMA49035.1 hypothetical protein C450_18614 [Halococcus salifodinae DSM 8989]
MTDDTVPDETDDSDGNEPTGDAEPTDNNESIDTEPSDDSTDGVLGTIVPALRPVVAFVVRFVWIVGRLLVAGGRIAITYLTDRERRIGARRWLLLEGNRWAIVGGLVASVFVVALIGGLTDVVGIAKAGFVTSLFGGIISGLFSFVPIVVAVNQLTISELFGTPDRLRERIESVRAFRGTVEERLPDVAVSPTDPGAFLAVAARVLSREAESLREAGVESGDAGLRERVDEYVEGVIGQVEQLTARADEENLPLIDVLLPMMGDGYAENINAARRIQSESADALTARADTLLDDLREMYRGLSILRQYYKALYIQQELARLSRLIVYSGLSAFLVSAFLILIFADGAPPSGHGPGMVVFVSMALAVAFAPFAVLFSFILRIATIAKRTASPGAFTPRGETPDYRQEEW